VPDVPRNDPFMTARDAGRGDGEGEADGAPLEPGLLLESEFLAEAQEIVDAASRTLLALDEARSRGDASPLLVGDVFRAVHTLKGLAGLFRPGLLGTLAHEYEELLQDLRLGRTPLDGEAMDLLFRGIETFGVLLAAIEAGLPEPEPEVRTLLAALARSRNALGRAASDHDGAVKLESWALDPNILAVLTEYEEHRLRLAVASGQRLFRAEVRFALATLDDGIEQLKTRLIDLGEIVTYLPTGDGADLLSIDLEILVVSRAPVDLLAAALEPLGARLEEVRRRDETLPPPAAPADEAAIRDRDRDRDRDDAAETGETRVSGGDKHLAVVDDGREGREARGAGDRNEQALERVPTVRVAIDRIDGLLDVVGELGLLPFAVARLESSLRQNPLTRREAGELSRLRRSLERHIGRIRSGILATRMVPLAQVVDRLTRAVRQIARESEKQVTFVATGAETELDKLLVEELTEPLLHLVRNAVDHGIEAKATRERLQKPVVGTLALNAFQKGNQVVVELEDDGAGMHPETLVARAIGLGLISPEEGRTYGRNEALSLVFLPGFTTRAEAGPLSGRGVGMDVVKTNIAALGGTVEVESEPDIGSKFTLTLPITLAVLQVLVVVADGTTFCLPLANLEEVFPLDVNAVRRSPVREMGRELARDAGREIQEVLPHRDAPLPLAPLGTLLFDAPEAGDARTPSLRERLRPGFVVVANFPGKRIGIVVDAVDGQQGIVVKALPAALRSARSVLAGATDLGDHRIGLVVDLGAVVDEFVREARPRLSPPALDERL
jgi:two-component system chemotaxis sensor kinase CheA